jgi:hypothetical protein
MHNTKVFSWNILEVGLQEIVISRLCFQEENYLFQPSTQSFFLFCREDSLDPTSNTASPSRLDDAKDGEGREINPTKNSSKPFRVILNEHVQKMTKGALPDYKAEKNADGKFVCTVTVFGKIYTSPSGMNSMSDAKESAASEACKVLQLAEAVPGNSPR